MSLCRATGRPLLSLPEIFAQHLRPVHPQPFLCPRLLLCNRISLNPKYREGRRYNQSLAAVQDTEPEPLPIPVSFTDQQQTSAQANTALARRQQRERAALPLSCPGCGALSQLTDPSQPGHYSPRATKAAAQYTSVKKQQIDAAIRKAQEAHPPEILRELGIDPSGPLSTQDQTSLSSEPDPPDLICDRCHQLVHHNSATPIIHPTLPSLSETISDSPHEQNHVYHVLDAADFPLSLLPNLPTNLLNAPLRSKNRRSQPTRYKSSRRLPTLSFLITRSDLLGPTEAHVNRLMPTLVQVLRDALGQQGERVRLGNVRCVSSRRSWWTGTVREEIWDRGGANWMVGMANVGKSRLFREVFPKGRMDASTAQQHSGSANLDALISQRANQDRARERERENARLLAEGSLLPPAQPEVMYPVMPTISPLPGTTASPIRVPFGSGRGELIDLPGLPRWDLTPYVEPEHRSSLLMSVRPRATQCVVHPRQSLLLGGGLVRITPTAESVAEGWDFLMHPFVALVPHVTNTEKALEQERLPDERLMNIPSVVTGEGKRKLRSAGVFELKSDVTKLRAGPVTRRDAAGIRVENLAFRVLSTDVLIAGVGWVEVCCQVRKRWRAGRRMVKEESGEGGDGMSVYDPKTSMEVREEEIFPAVEVFSPEGKGVGQRRPLECYAMSSVKLGPTRAKSS